ncbi:MAG TPA: endonuclease/exonuclease/phosphatase family protein [Polyangia bacterium]|jgi:endonuclease/exonuclease/phosphatase family metal-dependent hydrolase|nr:endonuclease/exonuclease/phosphatase family protein [Polyangia bacterium]
MRLRILTLNLWNVRGDVDRRMAVALTAVRELRPDVVALQEAIERPLPATGGLGQARAFAETLGGEVRFAVAAPDLPAGPMGNAIVSRLRLGEPRVLKLPAPEGDSRVALAVDVETPEGTFNCISTHLSWELDAAPVREEQVLALDAFAREHRRELPSVMAGDFNAPPDSQAIRFLTGRASLGGRGTYWRDAWALLHPHEPGYTWAARNPSVPLYVERDRRIDYVFVGPMGRDRRGAIVDARVGLDTPGPGPGPGYDGGQGGGAAGDGIYASDHFAVLVEIDLAPRPEPGTGPRHDATTR